jgi:hypothetical protein
VGSDGGGGGGAGAAEGVEEAKEGAAEEEKDDKGLDQAVNSNIICDEHGQLKGTSKSWRCVGPLWGW